jgi:hypothetical protein
MSTVKEARQKAFKLWTEYDNKANLSESAVHKLEFLIRGAYKGIEAKTEKYHKNEEYRELWNDWSVEYTRDIVNHAKSLGFENERNIIYTLEFDDTKYGLDTFREHWIKNVMNVDGFFARTTDTSGVFHRFMLFEESVVKFGLVDELDECGYVKLENLIDKCMDYIVSVVDQRILRYNELFEYVEDKRENALQYCEEYIRVRQK